MLAACGKPHSAGLAPSGRGALMPGKLTSPPAAGLPEVPAAAAGVLAAGCAELRRRRLSDRPGGLSRPPRSMSESKPSCAPQQIS